MDKLLTQALLRPYLAQIKRLSLALDFPLPDTDFSVGALETTPIIQSISHLQEVPTVKSVSDADFLVDLLIPYSPKACFPAGMGAIYLPQSFWETDLGRLIFQHYLYGIPEVFVMFRDASQRFRRQYGNLIRTGNLAKTKTLVEKIIKSKGIPYYTQASPRTQSRPNRYVRVDFLAKEINPLTVPIPDSKTSTYAFHQVQDSREESPNLIYKPWLRQLNILYSAFGFSSLQPYVGSKCKIAKAIGKVEESTQPGRTNSSLKTAVESADFLVDLLCADEVFEKPLPGWGATYLDFLFWRSDAGSLIYDLYEKAFGPSFYLLAHIPTKKESPSYKQNIYLRARRREIPIYTKPSEDPENRASYFIRKDHLDWLDK